MSRFLLQVADKENIKEKILNNSEKVALGLINSGYLKDVGWWTSFESKASLTIERAPLPWVTYSFINFIEKKINNSMVLFEYGTGNSTFFYQSRVATLHSVEHDLEWYNSVKDKISTNVKLLLRSLANPIEYERSVLDSSLKYDIVIVDGRNRVNCVKNAIQAVHNKSVIVLDDSERSQYLDAKIILRSKGYKELEFWGISPGFIAYNKCTSIFYRNNNILGI